MTAVLMLNSIINQRLRPLWDEVVRNYKEDGKEFCCKECMDILCKIMEAEADYIETTLDFNMEAEKNVEKR
jgi:hypothetical protein